MPRGKPWTKEEDQILIHHIDKGPDNITTCFENASFDLDRTPRACSNRWYGFLKKKDAVFQLSSDGSDVPPNVKNTPRSSISSIENILVIVFNSLSKKKKMEFIENQLKQLIKN